MSLGGVPLELLGQDSTRPASPGSIRERRLAYVLLALWCAAILYGSFIPFQLTLGHEGLWERMSRLQLLPFREGRRAFSVLDVASNVLLFVPFGALMALGRSPGPRRPSILPIAAAALLAGLLAMLIELGQLFAAGRTASLIDLAANMTGATLGAAAVTLVWRSEDGRLAAAATVLVRREPLVVPIALLAVTFLAEATYPFSITLDVSTLWGNLKAIQWVPFAVPRFWGDLVVDRGLRYALLGGMLAVVVGRHLSRMLGRTAAAGLVTAVAIGVELVKLLFEGRAPKVENAAVAIAGGLVGIAVLPAAARWDPLRRHPAAALAGLAILLLGYLELAPFEFRFDPAIIRARLPRIEWLPFQSYYGADFQSALFDLWGKVSISGLLGFAVTLGTGRGALASALVGLAAGSGLEALQIATLSRHPSVSDVLTIALGAALGGVVYGRYRAKTQRDPAHDGNPGHAPPGNRESRAPCTDPP
jgi:VanZ family protein